MKLSISPLQYAHTPFKNSITDSQLLTSHSLTLDLASVKHKILPSAGNYFNVPVFIYISFIKGLNQNPPRFTHEFTTQLAHVPLSSPFSSKQPIFHIQTTILVSFKFYFWPLSKLRLSNSLYFNVSCQLKPTLLIGSGVGRLHSVCILGQFFILIYLLPGNFHFSVMSYSHTPSVETAL